MPVSATPGSNLFLAKLRHLADRTLKKGNALRRVRRNPSSELRSCMLFDADPDQIAALDSTSLVKLLRRLVLSESRQLGIRLRGASVPLQITIADDGEEGRVEWDGGARRPCSHDAPLQWSSDPAGRKTARGSTEHANDRAVVTTFQRPATAVGSHHRHAGAVQFAGSGTGVSLRARR